MLPLLLMACATSDETDGTPVEISPPFSASTRIIPGEQWELQIDGTEGGNWSCKGILEGTDADSFDLPVQTVDLICVNGPETGVADYAPRTEARFTDLSFRLNNGFVGSTILK